MATPGQSMNTEAVIGQVKRLLNPQLRAVLRGINLPVSGAKAALQERIIAQVHVTAGRNDYDRFNRLRYRIFHPEQHDNHSHSGSPSHAGRSFQTDSKTPQHSPMYPPQYGPGPTRSIMPTSSITNPTRVPVFKPSPFYSIIQQLTPMLEIKVREQTRDTAEATIILRDDNVARLIQDPTIRVMIYCCAESLNSPFQRVDIAFPQQVELKVNGDDIKANLRGLKNKPGTTRPADITNFLRKLAGYENRLLVTYALTIKKFFLMANLVKQVPVSELVARLKAGNRRISKERVIREMKSRAEDSDIVATSSILSLKCPLSTLRMDVPCRSTVCTHNQCFDATSFLQLQEQAPTWTCPICNKAVSYDSLEIDEYVNNILISTPKSLDQVTIEPDGKWSKGTDAFQSSKATGGRDDSSEEDEELVEITDAPRPGIVKREQTSESRAYGSSPALLGNKTTPSTPATRPSTATKRTASQVVDLTLSSDEDEEQIRAPKRQATGGTSSMPSDRTPSLGTGNVPLRPNGYVNTDLRPPQFPNHSLPLSTYDARNYSTPI